MQRSNVPTRDRRKDYAEEDRSLRAIQEMIPALAEGQVSLEAQREEEGKKTNWTAIIEVDSPESTLERDIQSQWKDTAFLTPRCLNNPR